MSGTVFIMRFIFQNYKILFFTALLFVSCMTGVAFAQGQGQTPQMFEAKVRAANAVRLIAGKTPIQLWGVREINGMSAQFEVAARSGLDNVVGGAKIRCHLKNKAEGLIHAQCSNNADLDLGLYVLQQGYGVADRSVVYGTVFEEPYIQAEIEAQNQGLGVWASDAGGGNNEDEEGSFVFVLGAFLLLCILGAFAVLTLTIMRGFQKVTDAQEQNTDMIVRERQLRDKEREIFATMLDSEIKANKSKVEAYLVVYDEMLKSLKDEENPPKYKDAGDIVQAQPAMERAIFDRNTDKLDILGDQLSSEVIHFYARIKSKPDFINLEPDMKVEEAVGIVQKSYNNALRLNKISDRLIDLFEQGGHALEDEEEL